MKNIFFLMKYYLDPNESPPFPKFDYQMQALANLGYRISFLGIEHGTIFLCSDNTRTQVAKIPLHRIPGIGRLLTFNALYRATVQIFAKHPHYYVSYIRMMPAVPPMGRALKTIKESGCKLVMEFPTFPPEREEATEKRLHRKLFIWLSKRYELHLAHWFDLFTLIGTVQADSYRGVPAVNITNGISLEAIPERKYKPSEKDIHLLGVANVQMMNAYDRIINGIAHYNKSRTTGDPDIHFHIVGPDRDGSREKLKDLVKTMKIQSYVHFEGPAFGKDLNRFFDTADVAVGSLGLHRIGHTGIATLKAREYLAHGIPYIASGIDPVIPQDRNWNLNVKQDESPVDMHSVLEFISQARSNEEIGAQMREFARKNLSWESQFLQVFTALESLEESRKESR